jgi:hypothetical protein
MIERRAQLEGSAARSHGVPVPVRAGLILSALLLAVSAIAASSASAVLKRLPNGQTVSYQPLRDARSQVTPFDSVFTRDGRNRSSAGTSPPPI